MTKFLKITAAVALVSVSLASFASAGLNPAASAAMYWVNGTAAASLDLLARDTNVPSPNMIVTCKGINSFAGCDVQLLVNALDGGPVPAAWQSQSGGCGEGTFFGFPGGKGTALSGTHKNVFLQAVAVPGPLASQNGPFYNTGDCKTPHGVMLLWLSDAGGSGVSRNPATEYALWWINFDLANAIDAAGLPCDDGTRGVCINPNRRLPCTDAQRGAAIELLDAAFNSDFPGFAAGKTFLTWNAGPAGGTCPGVTGTKSSTWGTLKKLYK